MPAPTFPSATPNEMPIAMPMSKPVVQLETSPVGRRLLEDISPNVAAQNERRLGEGRERLGG
jgi:hypothetical protein